jgi:prevent-host-death family protein
MERIVTATEARVRFGELMQRVVRTQQPVIVERGGKPQVVVLSIPQYERLRSGKTKKNEWKELVHLARKMIRSDLGDRELSPPEEIIREMREERNVLNQTWSDE